MAAITFLLSCMAVAMFLLSRSFGGILTLTTFSWLQLCSCSCWVDYLVLFLLWLYFRACSHVPAESIIWWDSYTDYIFMAAAMFLFLLSRLFGVILTLTIFSCMQPCSCWIDHLMAFLLWLHFHGCSYVPVESIIWWYSYTDNIFMAAAMFLLTGPATAQFRLASRSLFNINI
jgi:hypothetical protein